MQVNHIDENTIRVRIDKDELAARGLKVLDLLGNKEMIQHFFYSILAEVDTDHTFTKNEPVSFQIMPNSEGLDLVISKVKDDGSNNLQKMLGDKNSSNGEDQYDEQRRSFFDLNPDDDPKTDLTPEMMDKQDPFATTEEKNKYWKFQSQHFYQFDDLSEVVELSDSLRVNDLASSLYYFKGKYFLKLAFLDENYIELTPADAWAIANEYGIKINDEQMKIVQKEGKCIIERDALNNLRHYFKQQNH